MRGVRVHNLRGIDVQIPIGKLTVLTGVSGAGKSSLAFDALYAEAQRRYLQSQSARTRQSLERFDKPDAETISALPPAIAVRAERSPLGKRATVGTLSELSQQLALLFATCGDVFCPQCQTSIQAHSTNDVVHALASWPSGTLVSVAFPFLPRGEKAKEAHAAELREQGFVRVQVGADIVRLGEQPLPQWKNGARAWVIVDRLETGKTPQERCAEAVELAFARGDGRIALLTTDKEALFERRWICPSCAYLYPTPTPALFRPEHANGTAHWSKDALCVRLAGATIADLSSLPSTRLSEFLADKADTAARSEQRLLGSGTLIELMRARLELLARLRLGYLSLDRPANSLSAGEMRRLRLASVLAAGLNQALYILEEPTRGLHVSEIPGMIDELLRLRDRGATLVVIEQASQVIQAADQVIELGPGAGEEGGQVTFVGQVSNLSALAGSGGRLIPAPLGGRGGGDEPAGGRVENLPSETKPWRSAQHWLRLSGANTHNLENLDVDFPLGVLCVVSGVSGAGKSSLLEHTLFPALCRAKGKKNEYNGELSDLSGVEHVGDVVLVDHIPPPRSARGNPASFLKIFDDIRNLFAQTAEAQTRNFDPGHFSFHQPGGRCETCQGQGTLAVDMQFLADVAMTCPDCQGARFRKEILAVTYRHLSIAEVLNLTAREAFRFFRTQPAMQRRLKPLLDVGLDYLRLGQPLETLSTGEGQRLKLAAHLASSRKPRCLYILLEPTAGLHAKDVQTLLACFDRLLESGHSLIVEEHHLDVIRAADYVIDLDPGIGESRGVGQARANKNVRPTVIHGTPEEIMRHADSITGKCLRALQSGMNAPGTIT